MISDEEIIKIINDANILEMSDPDNKKVIECLKLICGLECYEDVIDVIHAFLKETSNQVKRTSSHLVVDAVNEVLADTLEDHGWLDGEDVSKDVNREIYKENKNK